MKLTNKLKPATKAKEVAREAAETGISPRISASKSFAEGFQISAAQESIAALSLSLSLQSHFHSNVHFLFQSA